MSPLLPIVDIKIQNPRISEEEIEKIENMMKMIPESTHDIPNDLLKEIENIHNPSKFSDLQLIEELESFSKTLL